MAVRTSSTKLSMTAFFDCCLLIGCIIGSMVAGAYLSVSYTVLLSFSAFFIGIAMGLCALIAIAPFYRFYHRTWLTVAAVVIAALVSIWLQTSLAAVSLIVLGAVLGALAVVVAFVVYIIGVLVWYFKDNPYWAIW